MLLWLSEITASEWDKPFAIVEKYGTSKRHPSGKASYVQAFVMVYVPKAEENTERMAYASVIITPMLYDPKKRYPPEGLFLFPKAESIAGRLAGKGNMSYDSFQALCKEIVALFAKDRTIKTLRNLKPEYPIFTDDPVTYYLFGPNKKEDIDLPTYQIYFTEENLLDEKMEEGVIISIKGKPYRFVVPSKINVRFHLFHFEKIGKKWRLSNVEELPGGGRFIRMNRRDFKGEVYKMIKRVSKPLKELFINFQPF